MQHRSQFANENSIKHVNSQTCEGEDDAGVVVVGGLENREGDEELTAG